MKEYLLAMYREGKIDAEFLQRAVDKGGITDEDRQQILDSTG